MTDRNRISTRGATAPVDTRVSPLNCSLLHFLLERIRAGRRAAQAGFVSFVLLCGDQAEHQGCTLRRPWPPTGSVSMRLTKPAINGLPRSIALRTNGSFTDVS